MLFPHSMSPPSLRRVLLTRLVRTCQAGKGHKGYWGSGLFVIVGQPFVCGSCLHFSPYDSHSVWVSGTCCLSSWTSDPLSGFELELTIVDIYYFVCTHMFSPYYWQQHSASFSNTPISLLVRMVPGVLVSHNNLSTCLEQLGSTWNTIWVKESQAFIGTWQERFSLPNVELSC